ncbi:MAG: hypothetical protein IRZ03_13045 [Acidobacterium ailaaui]|nr:hypothetical protein [Pseudacidobacterium ailaaui]
MSYAMNLAPPVLLNITGPDHIQWRKMYILYIPLFLFCAAFLGWAFPTDSMLAVDSAAGGLAGGYVLWDVVVKQAPLRFSHIFFIANAFGYGFGAFNSWLSIPREDISLANYFLKDTEIVTRTMAAVLVSSAVLCIFGEIFEKPIFPPRLKLKVDTQVVVLIVLGTAMLLVGYVTGNIGYMGGVAKGGGSESIFTSFLMWIYPALFATTALGILNSSNGLKRWGLVVFLVIQFVLILPTGRRNLIYSILLAVIVGRFSASNFLKRWSLFKKVAYLTAMVVVLSVSLLAFYYLRVAGYGTKRTLSTYDRISMAIQIYESGYNSRVKAQFINNLEQRTFVLGYLSDLLGASEQKTPAMGNAIYHELLVTIPGILWEDKNSSIYQEEGIANMQFNFSYIDEANSILTSGALDFGIWGMIAYPVMISVLFAFSNRITSSFLPPTIGAFITFALLFDAFSTETEVWGHLVTLRNSLIFAIFFWCYFKIFHIYLPERSSSRELIQGWR